MSTAACRACRGTWPAADHRIADLGPAVASLHDDQFFPGWTVLVLKRHATELWQLDAPERAALIEAVSRLARALADVFDAAKMNYELLGNELPHVHWHLVPRGADDPAPRRPVWTVAHEPRRLPPEDLAARSASIARRLER